MSDTPITVMIPLGGIGSRFQKEGYTQPKPFVPVLGEAMILKVLRSMKLDEKDAIVIVYNPEFIPTESWDSVKEDYPKLSLVTLPGPTRGAAETVLIGLKGLSRSLRSRPVLLADGDTFYDEDVVGKFREVCKESNAVFYFDDTQPKPMYSYIKTDESGRILEVKEKVKISDKANSGCYCFKSGLELEDNCKKLLDAQQTQLSQDAVGEYYTSGVIARMLEQGSHFVGLQIDPKKYHVVGTPSQLEAWCRAHREETFAKRFWFEIQLRLGFVGFDKANGVYTSEASPLSKLDGGSCLKR